MEDYKRYSEMLEELIAHIDLKDELKAVVNSNINLARVMCEIDNKKELKKIQHYDISKCLHEGYE